MTLEGITCATCKVKPATFQCPGGSPEIPERLFHDPHPSCWDCDRGAGCAMIALPTVGIKPQEGKDTV